MESYQKIIIIVGLTEAIKQFGISSDYSASIAIVIGAIMAYLENPTPQGILEGVLLGAVVTGSYAVIKRIGRGAKSSIQKKPDYSKMEADDRRL